LDLSINLSANSKRKGEQAWDKAFRASSIFCLASREKKRKKEGGERKGENVALADFIQNSAAYRRDVLGEKKVGEGKEKESKAWTVGETHFLQKEKRGKGKGGKEKGP